MTFFWSILLYCVFIVSGQSDKSNMYFMNKHLKKSRYTAAANVSFHHLWYSHIAHYIRSSEGAGCNHCSHSNNTGTLYRLQRRHSADHGGILYLNYALYLHYWEHNCCQGTVMMSMQLHWYYAVSALFKCEILTMQNLILKKGNRIFILPHQKNIWHKSDVINQTCTLKVCWRI